MDNRDEITLYVYIQGTSATFVPLGFEPWFSHQLKGFSYFPDIQYRQSVPQTLTNVSEAITCTILRAENDAGNDDVTVRYQQ